MRNKIYIREWSEIFKCKHGMSVTLYFSGNKSKDMKEVWGIVVDDGDKNFVYAHMCNIQDIFKKRKIPPPEMYNPESMSKLLKNVNSFNKANRQKI